MATGTRAIQLYDSRIPSPSLDILGRCSREESCDGEPNVAGGLSSRLHLLNGGLLNQKIVEPKSNLQMLIQQNKTTVQIVTFFYERAFTRNPDSAELAFWQQRIEHDLDEPEGATRTQRLEDFVWSILNSKEFTTNH
jgi:hypothetical protein